MGKIFDDLMESMDYFIELERGKRMLSREDVIRKMQGLECPNYLRETCYEPIQEQAIKAIELQAKLDEYTASGLTPSEINLYVKCQAQQVSKRELALKAKLDKLELWCNSPITIDDFGYQMAIDYVRQILRGLGDVR